MLSLIIYSGSEGPLVCQTSQHVGPVRSIDVNPFQVTMTTQHTQVFINPMGGEIEVSKYIRSVTLSDSGVYVLVCH